MLPGIDGQAPKTPWGQATARAEPPGEAWPERPGTAGAKSGKLAHR